MTLRYPQVLLLLCTLTALSPAIAADSVKLDTPIGGWRSGAPEGEGESFRQTVNYPASSVNTPVGQANTARISGEIKATPKSREPGRLIVNGVSMPLKIDESGRFDRPFSFPNGSNSVEVRSPDGQQRHRTQFLNTSGGATPPNCAYCWRGTATAPTSTCTSSPPTARTSGTATAAPPTARRWTLT